MITGGKRMRELLQTGKVNPNVGGQVIDLYNKKVSDNISHTILTTVDSSSMTFVSIMKNVLTKEIEGDRYELAIRKFTPRECFRLMGVHDEDIDKLLTIDENGKQAIPNSKLYQLAGNSIVTNCMTAMFEELFYPSGKQYVDKAGQLSLF